MKICFTFIIMALLGSFFTARAEDPSQFLNKEVEPSQISPMTMDQACSAIEERSGCKVSISPDLKDLIRSVPTGSTSNGTKTLRSFLDSVCFPFCLRWEYEPEKKIIHLEPAWKITDPRSSEELLKAVQKMDFVQPGGSILREPHKEEKKLWLHDFNALLSKPENYPAAWKVRLRADLDTGFFPGSDPIAIVPFVSMSREKFVLLVLEKAPITYPGRGNLSYYWFREDGSLAGAGVMDVGNTFFGKVSVIKNETSSELQLETNWKTKARFVLDANGLRLLNTDLPEYVGKSMLKP